MLQQAKSACCRQALRFTRPVRFTAPAETRRAAGQPTTFRMHAR